MLLQTIRALLVAAMLLQSFAALAVDPARLIVQYTHRRWSDESNPPRPIFAIAQDKDGYLWVAANVSLYRFDGINFETIEAPGGSKVNGSPGALLVTSNGDVWTHFDRSGRFATFRDGALRYVPSPPPGGLVSHLVEGKDGAIWAGLANSNAGIMRYHHGRWTHFRERDGLPNDQMTSILVASDGTLWVAYFNSVLRFVPSSQRFEPVLKVVDGHETIAQDPAGRIWLIDKKGARAITGPAGRGAPPSVRFPYRTDETLMRGRPMFDRAGNLWLALGRAGLQRVATPDPSGAASPLEAIAQVESIGTKDGLTSELVWRTMEDREGNIWVSTEEGLDKFRPSTVRFEPSLIHPATYGDRLLGASDGSVYVAQADAVYRIRPGGEPEKILTNPAAPEAMCEAPDGAIWIAFVNRLLSWKGGQVRQISGKPETVEGFYDCAFDRSGDYWATAVTSGIFRYRAGKWQKMFAPPKDGVFNPVMIAGRDKQLVLQWGLRTLNWLDFPARRSMAIDYGKDRPILRTLYSDARGDIVAAGTFGLSRFRGGQVQTVSAEQVPALLNLNGLVQTPDGQTWGAGQSSIRGMRSQDLERAFVDRSFHPPAIILGEDDGLPNRISFQSMRSIVRGGDGRLWITTMAGTISVNPKQLQRNKTAPGVVIASVLNDGELHRNPTSLRLPAAPSNIEINYAALSFANPKKSTVRYRLEGYDAGWIDPGMRRQAFYTNLAPGKYRFRVIAANNEGVWNRTGASVDFEIPPTFFQSNWFLALCIAVGLLLLWLLYRLRLAQMARSIRNRLEERLSERERIARELHDTLLQSVQGLILRFQSVANRMPPTEQTRLQLDTALKRADDIIVDGRNRVRDLRPSHQVSDLRAALQELADTAGFDPPIPIRVVVEGKQQPVDPMISDEVRRIVGEALFNVARHASARSIDATISFAPQLLTVQIRDDGVGMPPEVLAQGSKPDHYGLIGMRERAERMGGALSIASQPGEGCEVTLTLPARVAYGAPMTRSWTWSWFSRLWKEPALA